MRPPSPQPVRPPSPQSNHAFGNSLGEHSLGRDFGYNGSSFNDHPRDSVSSLLGEPLKDRHEAVKKLDFDQKGQMNGGSYQDRHETVKRLDFDHKSQMNGGSFQDRFNGSTMLISPPIDAAPMRAELATTNSSMISPSPRTPSGMAQDPPEVARRAAEWERQIESLDQKEMEIHQTQLRLIREQTATFRGDLLALRQEVLELKTHSEEGASAHGRLERHCSELSEGLGRHQQLHQDSDRRLALQRQAADKLSQEMELARNRLDQLHGLMADQHAQFAQQSSLADRVGLIEKAVSDTAAKHSQGLSEAQVKLEHLHGRIACFESTHCDLKRVHSQLADDRVELDTKHSTIAERVGFLEKTLGDSVEKHGKELEAVKGLHAKHVNDVKSSHASLQAAWQQEREFREQHHSSVQVRLNSLESALGESADRQAKELESLKGSHSRMYGGHATVAERLAYVERQLGHSVEKHQQELSSAHGRIEQLHGRIASMETQGSAVESLKKAHASLLKEKADLDRHHATVKERVDYLERVIGDSADKHNRELEELKAAHRALAGESKVREKGHCDLKDRLEQYVKVLSDSADKHEQELRGAHTRLEQLHGRVQEERKARELHHSATREQLAAEQGRREVHQATIEERIGFVEKALGDSADRHARELEGLKGSHAMHLEQTKAFQSKHGSVEERLDYIEHWFRGFRPP